MNGRACNEKKKKKKKENEKNIKRKKKFDSDPVFDDKYFSTKMTCSNEKRPSDFQKFYFIYRRI